jgi:hypothetical protein
MVYRLLDLDARDPSGGHSGAFRSGGRAPEREILTLEHTGLTPWQKAMAPVWEQYSVKIPDGKELITAIGAL